MGACGCRDFESMRHYLWHGNVGRALALIEDFSDGFDLIRDPPTTRGTQAAAISGGVQPLHQH